MYEIGKGTGLTSLSIPWLTECLLYNREPALQVIFVAWKITGWLPLTNVPCLQKNLSPASQQVQKSTYMSITAVPKPTRPDWPQEARYD